MANWRLRLRRALDRQFTTVVVILLICALIGGWVSYSSHVAVEPTTEDRTVTIWETTGEFSHGTVVEESNSVFPEGSRLSSRPVYFTRISPELTGRFQSSYAGTSNATLTRNVSVGVIIRAVDREQAGTDSEVYWRTSNHLNGTTVENVSPRDPIIVSFTQNMTEINNQIDRINEQLGSTAGETEVIFRTTVDSRGMVDGKQIDETNSYAMPVELNEDTYRIADTQPTTDAYETSRTETVEPTPGAGRQIGGPALGVISLLMLSGLVVSRWRGTVELSDSEQKRLRYQETREEFDDWISRIELPAEAFDLPEGKADSLSALVDIAIDTNNSVVEDPEEEIFYVRHNGYLYSYQPPTQPSNSESKNTDNEPGDTDGETADTDGKSGETDDHPPEESDAESRETADNTSGKLVSSYGGIVRHMDNQR